MKNYFASILLLFLLAIPVAQAQEVVWSVDFHALFNNREGGDEMRPDQTFLFTRLSPEVGVKLATRATTSHLLKGGVTWFQPVNDRLDGCKVLPTLYYRYQYRGRWAVAMGMLPRTQLVERAPRYLWSDSMSYHQPNIRGVLAQYHHGNGSWVELYLDWRQLQSETRREAFNVDFNGKWFPFSRQGLWLGGYLQYNHLAKCKNAPEGEGVNDDLTLNPMLGYNWKWGGRCGTTVQLKAGAVINKERARCDSKWLTASGFVGNAHVRWKFLEAEENIYSGSNLFPLYNRFGSQLNMGDTYYCSKFYSRTDLVAHIVQNAFVDLNTSFTFHANKETTGFWQQISCRVYIDNNIWKHRHDKKKLRAGRLNSIYTD